MRRPRTVAATVKRRPKYVVAGLAPGKVIGGIKKRGPGPEEVLHRSIAEFMTRATLPYECLWWHTPNGGARTPAEGGILKAMGVKAGIPDMFVLWHGELFGIELKSGDGKLSPVQIAMHRMLECQGVRVVVARSIDDVDAALRRWGIPTHARTRTAP